MKLSLSLLKETIRRLLKENDEQMYIDKINSILEPYWETERNYTSTAQPPPADDNYNTAMELASTLGLENHPGLRIWGAMDGETGDMIDYGLLQQEAMSLTVDQKGQPIKTDGKLYGNDYAYYYL